MIIPSIALCDFFNIYIKRRKKMDFIEKKLDIPLLEWYNNITSCRGFFFCVQIQKTPSSLREVRGYAASMNLSGGADNMRVKITLACSECKQRNYNTMKNKKNDPDRLEMNKYCRFCRKHTLHKESK